MVSSVEKEINVCKLASQVVDAMALNYVEYFCPDGSKEIKSRIQLDYKSYIDITASGNYIKISYKDRIVVFVVNTAGHPYFKHADILGYNRHLDSADLLHPIGNALTNIPDKMNWF